MTQGTGRTAGKVCPFAEPTFVMSVDEPCPVCGMLGFGWPDISDKCVGDDAAHASRSLAETTIAIVAAGESDAYLEQRAQLDDADRVPSAVLPTHNATLSDWKQDQAETSCMPRSLAEKGFPHAG